MRSASAALIALINSGNREFVQADLYTWSKYDGSVLARYTDADLDLVLGGFTFLSSGPVFKRDHVRTGVGIQVDEMSVTVAADDTMLLAGVPWLKALRDGVMDGGRLSLDRFLSDSFTNLSVGTVKWFGGRIAGIDIGRSAARITVNSDTELLDVQFPINVYQPPCRWTLFGSGCGLSRAAFSFNSTVAAGSGRQVINCGLAQSTGYFDLGILQFTSGPNTGALRMVRSYVPGVIVLSSPLVNSPTVGDAFTVSPGCDKTQATCDVKFGNLPNFGGQPYVPIAISP
jgi:uncharacterized phage protein (TIGR02218 family)